MSPRDKHNKAVVPDEYWAAVTALRELYKERAIIGQNLSTVDAAMRDLVARNPALSRVPAPQLVPA